MQIGGSKRYSVTSFGALGDFIMHFRRENWKRMAWLSRNVEIVLYAHSVHPAVSELASCFLRCDGGPLFDEIVLTDFYQENLEIKEKNIFETEEFRKISELEPKILICEDEDLKRELNFPYIVFHPYGSRPEVTLTNEEFAEVLGVLVQKAKVVQIGSSIARFSSFCSNCKIPASGCRCPKFPRDECILFREGGVKFQHPNFIDLADKLNILQSVTVAKNAIGFVGTDSVWMNFVAVFREIPAFILLRRESDTFGPYWNYLQVTFGSWAWKEGKVWPLVFLRNDTRKLAETILEGMMV